MGVSEHSTLLQNMVIISMTQLEQFLVFPLVSAFAEIVPAAAPRSDPAAARTDSCCDPRKGN
jgi:hypothetical protein